MIEDQPRRRGHRDIAAVKGIAGLHIGPVDLGLGLGLNRDDPRFADALQKHPRDAGHAVEPAGDDACGPPGPGPPMDRKWASMSWC